MISKSKINYWTIFTKIIASIVLFALAAITMVSICTNVEIQPATAFMGCILATVSISIPAFIICSLPDDFKVLSEKILQKRHKPYQNQQNQLQVMYQSTNQSLKSRPNSDPKSNVYTTYQTDAIGIVKVINQSSNNKKLIVAGISYQDQPKIISQSEHSSNHIRETEQQQLTDVIKIIRTAISMNIHSIQIAYNFAGIQDYINDLPKNNLIALRYVQEINDLSQHIKIVFISENLSDNVLFTPLNTYLLQSH